MTYQIEDFEPLPEEQFEEVQNELPLDGSVSIMELAQRQMNSMENETETTNEVDKVVSGMPAISDLLKDCQPFEASPVALAKVPRQTDEIDHPLERLGVGMCYTLPLDWFNKADLAKLRSAVSMWANRNSRKFCVITHKTMNILEIARVD